MTRTRRKPGRKPGAKARPVLPGIDPGRVYSEREAASILKMRRSRVAEEREAGRLIGRGDGRRFIHLGRHLLDWIEGRWPQKGGR